MFQDNKGLGKDALKFAKTFAVTVDHKDRTQCGTMEDWYSMGHILGEHGQRVTDFKSVEDALAAVRHLCAKNAEEHGYAPKPECLDESFLQFSKFWFIFSLGKTTLHVSDTTKKLEQSSDLKTLAQLDQAKLFLEGMGFEATGASSTVKIENEKATGLKKLVELLKLPYTFRCTIRRSLESPMAVDKKQKYIYIYMYIYVCVNTHTHMLNGLQCGWRCHHHLNPTGSK